MALTRAQAEKILIRRVGGWLTKANLDGTTIAGTNVDLSDPLAYGVIVAGGTVSDLSVVASADLATVADADLNMMLDVAELRALESALSNFTLVDAKAGPVEAKMNDLGQRLERRIALKRAEIQARYGIDGAAVIETGVITLNFAELDDGVVITS